MNNYSYDEELAKKMTSKDKMIYSKATLALDTMQNTDKKSTEISLNMDEVKHLIDLISDKYR